MAQIKNILNDNLFKILGLVLLFLLINFNQTLGMIYIFMLVLDWIMYNDDSFISLPEVNPGFSWGKSVLLAALAYVGFLIVSSVVLQILSFIPGVGTNISLNSILSLINSTTPVFSNSVILSIIGWGILIPMVETNYFFGRVFEWLMDMYNVKIKPELTSGKIWAIMIVIAGTFALFHATAKGVNNPAALAVTAIFAVYSMWLILFTKELRTTVLLHVFTNLIAVLLNMGVIK